MSQSVLGQEAIVAIEWSDGRIYRGKTFCASVEMRSNPIEITKIGDSCPSYMPGLTEWEMNFQGTGSLEFTRGQAKEMRSAIEWKCEWCGAIMPKVFRSCSQCGGQRSFLYDI